MNISYPHTIENCIGEKLIFREAQRLSRAYNSLRRRVANTLLRLYN
ncbi:hypothetical protein [Spirosoma endophyticum]|uniref:Uncharacterized protein n=1 Tax=Spirosoma endophyticum TaxID=662367 RepID=A0A1I1HH61_9BACT|nr:hypothetical protein [Spirosoma endophyticum]SFC23489.1 hypothetical protein SAMN05216167_101707 [Spirosoma endophyticum]